MESVFGLHIVLILTCCAVGSPYGVLEGESAFESELTESPLETECLFVDLEVAGVGLDDVDDILRIATFLGVSFEIEGHADVGAR